MLTKGDTRSLDYSSYGGIQAKLPLSLCDSRPDHNINEGTSSLLL